jgi:REP element-mobilizing transposase RayT
MVPDAPRAYLITWSTKGSRLHGDPRGTVDSAHNKFGSPMLEVNALRQSLERRRLRDKALELSAAHRAIVANALREVAAHRRWHVLAAYAGTNHVHIVAEYAGLAPERMMNDWKAWSTRKLREAGCIAADDRPWTRHGSTRCLWDESSVAAAVAYVQEGQDVPR